jgi:hypothetical protein
VPKLSQTFYRRLKSAASVEARRQNGNKASAFGLSGGDDRVCSTTHCFRSTPQEIYVWQRVWNEQVEAAVTQAGKSTVGFAVLAAEIDVRESAPKIFRPDLKYAALKASGRSIALTVRIDPSSGPFIERRCGKTKIGQEAIKRHWFVQRPENQEDSNVAPEEQPTP